LHFCFLLLFCWCMAVAVDVMSGFMSVCVVLS
jgi:hypothetical protein